jgi:hypothetical protein
MQPIDCTLCFLCSQTCINIIRVVDSVPANCLITASYYKCLLHVIEICGCGKCKAFRSAANTAARLEVYRSLHWCKHGFDEALCTHYDCTGHSDDEVFSDTDYDSDGDDDEIYGLRVPAVCSWVLCSVSTVKPDAQATTTDDHLPGKSIIPARTSVVDGITVEWFTQYPMICVCT